LLTASVSTQVHGLFSEEEDDMTTIIDRAVPRDEIAAIAERASLYAVLLSALVHQRRPQELPPHLYADLGMYPSQQPDFLPKGR